MVVLLSLLALLTAATPIGLAIRPGAEDTFTAVVTGDATGDSAGAFTGGIALNGSTAELRAAGEAERSGGRLRLPLTLRYAEIPADWVNRFRLGTFDYRVHGTVAGRVPVDWRGTMAWKEVEVEGEKETVSRFVRLSSLRLTRFSLFESEARASVAVRNPFSFPLKVAGATYRLLANGREVGSGETRGLLLHPRQDNSFDFPIDIEHGDLLAAAGSALASGGAIEGRLQGELRVRLPAGDIVVPLDLSGRLDLLAE